MWLSDSDCCLLIDADETFRLIDHFASRCSRSARRFGLERQVTATPSIRVCAGASQETGAKVDRLHRGGVGYIQSGLIVYTSHGRRYQYIP